MSAPAEKYSAARVQGREHIPIFPKNFIAIRIVQLVLCVIVLALSAYGVAAGYAANGIVFILAVALMTLITSIYHLVAEFSAPNAYNYWAVLSLDIFLVIMWLASFALLAAAVAIWAAYAGGGYYVGYVYYYTYGYSKGWVGALAGASAIGAMEFVLHVISLIIVGVMIHRHRGAGLHCSPGAAATPPGQGPPGAPVGVAAAAPAPVPVAAQHEKMQPAPQYSQEQAAHQTYTVQQQPTQIYTSHQTVSPPPQQMYAAPGQQPQQQYYPQQPQQVHQPPAQ